MDVSLTPTQTHTSNTTTTTTTGSTKSPEPDPDTPTRAPQPSKPSHFSNGVLKRHNGLGHSPVVASAYKECLRNHAASLGGHALDGCLEFMPSPTSTASDPTSLRCAACGCHRNFHRREPDHLTVTPTPLRLPAIEYQPHHRHHPPPPPPPQPLHPPALPRSPSSASPPPISSHPPSSAPHMLLALSAAPESSVPRPPPPLPSLQGLASSLEGGSGPARKRFRTKFSQSQKERMFEFAERVGWRMQKREDDAIREFCNDVGVDRGVFKVWMHNNKNTFGKPRVVLDHFGGDKPDSSACNPGTSSANPVANNEDAPVNPAGGSTTQDLLRIHHHHHHIQQHHDQPPMGTNGSASSS
ncbi:hypothetical protein MLD38_001319 [Melastoma candidum]|uniref:Uncharacterized protein n=1 Tax=Melastoma candidum TaxID=119954 RepID=A0ACB9SCB9_9MYRT|nr:hypothetical protein MLD38_001319 [Melastoma candidum]